METKNINTNIDIIQKILRLDNKTITVVKAELMKRLGGGGKYSFLSALSIMPWFVRLVSIYERKVFKMMCKHYDWKGNDVVFVSCIDPVHRVKYFPLIAKDISYMLFFMPTVTRPMEVRKYYLHYSTNSNEKVFFGTFSAEDVRLYRKFLKDNVGAINQIKCDNYNDTKILRDYVKRYALYSIYSHRVFNDISNDKVWLFEHDKFFFIPVLSVFRNKMIPTVQLQHGTFFDPNQTTYFPLYTDKIICCSEREAILYQESGVERKDISIVGAPLQTIGHKIVEECEIKYDIAVILTDTSPQLLKIQKKALTYLRDHYKYKKILIRFRPRSIDQDKQNLANYVDGFSISKGSSLMQDLCSSKRIITFSLDAIFEMIQAKKNFVVIVSPSVFHADDLNGICYSIDEMDKAMDDLFNGNDDKRQERYITVFGETDEDKIRENFKNTIFDLKTQIIKQKKS